MRNSELRTHIKTGNRANLFAAFMLSAGFALAQLPALAQTFTTLHSFDALVGLTNNDGALPYPALLLSGNTFYGTTYKGGASSNGAVFAINRDGTGFTNMHSFSAVLGPFRTNADGSTPVAGLVLSGNTLYGTTGQGGPGHGGTIYAINTDGSGFTNLHVFSGFNDGNSTTATLLLSGNTLYGASQGGGSNAFGIIFTLNTDGSGYTNIHTFQTETGGTNSGGGQPVGGLVMSGTNLFGTTWSGGTGGKGTIFRMNADGTGFTNLHSFAALVSNTNSDGAMPMSTLTLGGNTLYGVTGSGGANGNGVLFAINTDGTGFTNFHSFTALNNSSNVDGAAPFGSLFLSGNTLYGTAPAGGSGTNGTVFAVNTDGTDFTVLYNFSRLPGGTNSDGAGPASGIISSNTLFGVAHFGGSGGSGTVFSLFLAPELTLSVSGTNAILTWPTNADGFALQSTTNLTPPAVWNAVSSPAAVINSQNAVTDIISEGAAFYRLAR